MRRELPQRLYPPARQGGQEAALAVSPAVDLPPLWAQDRVAGQRAGGLMAGAARPMSLVRSADFHAVPHHRGGRSRPVDRRRAGLRTDGPFPRGRCAGHDSPRYRPHRCAPLPDSRRVQLDRARRRARPVCDGGCTRVHRRSAGRGHRLRPAVRRRPGGGLGLQGRSDGWGRHQDDGDGGGVRRLERRPADRIRGRVVRQPRYVPLLILGKRKRHVPFGVFLAMGAAVAFVFGPAIYDWYRRFLGAA